jgi:hypothetical protein
LVWDTLAARPDHELDGVIRWSSCASTFGHACVGEAQLRPAVLRCQLQGHYGFETLCGSGNPGQENQPVGHQAEEPAVMRVPLSSEVGFEKEDAVDFALHQHRSGRRKPAVELLRPRAKQRGRWRNHRPFHG